MLAKKDNTLTIPASVNRFTHRAICPNLPNPKHPLPMTRALPRPSRTTLVLCLVTLLAAAISLPAGESKPKNILLIMADDIGIEAFGSYGGETFATPHLDQLAKDGMQFSHAYSQPLCTPTRVQIMTGKYNHRNWLYFGILPPGERTFGHMMSDLGYKTLIAGKWQLTSYDPPEFPGADQRRNTGTHPRDAGFDEYILFHAEHTEDKGSRFANPTYLKNGELITEEGTYGEDVSVDYILEFMQRHADDPTFVYFPMALPHSPFNPTPDSEEWQDPSLRLDEDLKYYPDMVEYMDTLVGRLVAGLEEMGQRDNTLILFYSDNGSFKNTTAIMSGMMIPGGKSFPIQTGVRVPLIASWPAGMPAGTVSNDLVDASDFVPTLLDLAGHDVPADWHIDGQSFAPQLRGQEHPSPRESVFVWYDPRPGWGKDHLDRSVFALDHDYKLYDDGRFMKIDYVLPIEVELPLDALTPPARAAKEKLQAVIDAMMQPPLSPAVANEVDAYGNPVSS